MINILIFSKERQHQLHILLDSIHERIIGDYSIYILYKGNYDLIRNMFKNKKNIQFINEYNFEYQTKKIIFSSDKICFMVDDDYIYRDLDLMSVKDTDVFSLRIGRNIEYCYACDSNQKGSYIEEENYLRINVQESNYDFAYPMSLDGTIFSKRMLKIMMGLRFFNPNTFEESLQQIKVSEYYSFFQSSVINFPCNVVTSTHSNRSENSFTIDFLEKEYISGNIYTPFNFEINACHTKCDFHIKNIKKYED